MNRASEAESAFRSLYEDFADEQSALNLVNFLLRRNSLHEAFEIIERAAPQARAHVAAALWMAAAAVAQRLGSGDAERFVKLAHQADPGAPDVAAAVAQQAIAQGRLEDALAAAECGLCRDANDPALRYYAALACAKLQRKAEALAHLQTIPAERTGEAADLLQIALLRELDRHAEALVLTERVLRGNPANIDVVLIRSAILERLGRDAEAEAALRARLASGNERIAVELAGLYLRSGRVADARRVAERALA